MSSNASRQKDNQINNQICLFEEESRITLREVVFLSGVEESQKSVHNHEAAAAEEEEAVIVNRQS